MSEPSQKCKNYAIFKQNYTLELFAALKMAYSCCSGLRGNLDFLDFLQKNFYNINSRGEKVLTEFGQIKTERVSVPWLARRRLP